MGNKYLQNKETKEQLEKESLVLPWLQSTPGIVWKKEELMAFTGLSERQVRHEMERIANFYPVRATAGRKGYSLITFDKENLVEVDRANKEAFAQVCELQNRIDSLKARMKPLIATMRVTAVIFQEKEKIDE